MSEKKQLPVKLVIFDWDGTLVDSTARIVSCIHQAAQKVGVVAVSDRQAKHIIGLGLPEAINVLWPTINQQEHTAICQAYVEFFSRGSEIGVSFYSGVRELLHQLKDAGVLLAVATGKTRKGLDAMIEDMKVQGVFDITRCADETLSKPDPLMLQQILNEMSLEPEQALMIGDTTFDLQMALNIKMPSVGMLYGAHEKEMLESCQPISVCQDVPALEKILKAHVDF